MSHDCCHSSVMILQLHALRTLLVHVLWSPPVPSSDKEEGDTSRLQNSIIQLSFGIALLTGNSEVHLHASVAHMQ